MIIASELRIIPILTRIMCASLFVQKAFGVYQYTVFGYWSKNLRVFMTDDAQIMGCARHEKSQPLRDQRMRTAISVVIRAVWP